MLQIISKRISDNYKKTLVDMFPKEFQTIEQLDKYQDDVAKHLDRFDKTNIIQIIYHPKDIKEIEFTLSTKQSEQSFVKRSRPRGEKYFRNKPEITTPIDSKQVLKLKIITEGYSINMYKDKFRMKPSTINKFNFLTIKEEINYNNEKNKSYVDFYTPKSISLKYGYLAFQNEESKEYFMKQYLK